MGGHQLRFGESPPPVEIQRPERLGTLQGVTYGNAQVLLQPGSGFMKAYKFLINPYSGCGFGCEYCYARFFAPTPEARDTWGTWVRVKENAVDLIRKATRAKNPERRLMEDDCVYMSSVTDPYQPIESKLGLTRRILEALIRYSPVSRSRRAAR